MNNGSELHLSHGLVLLVATVCTSLLTGYFFLGARTFQLNYVDSPFLSIGIGGAIVYFLQKTRGAALGIMTAVLLAILNAIFASHGFGSILTQTLLMLLMIVLLCYLLRVWKIEKPAYGRLLLLGPLFGIAMGLDMLIARWLIYSGDYVLEASKNQALNGFRIGVGLAIGLEIAEWINSRLRGKWSLAKHPVNAPKIS